MTEHYGGGREFEAEPARAAFVARYRDGQAQVAWTRLVADLETPVSAYLKLCSERTASCLLESIEGGAARGRYSIIGLAPDVVWRTFGDKAEINRQAHLVPDRFLPETAPALQSLRALLAQSRIDLPPELPPIAAGVIGYLGHDTVRLIERLPNVPPDSIGVPDGMLVRPTVMVVFDNVKDEIIVVTPVRPETGTDAQTAYAATSSRWCCRSASPSPFRCPPSRSTARSDAPTPRRSCSTSTSAASPWWAPARRSWCACATAR
jgi:anthranilate synthase component I